MHLDKENGILYIGELEITPQFHVSDLSIQSNIYSWVKGAENAGYQTFLLRDIEDGEYSLFAIFYKEKISLLRISNGSRYTYPPFLITDEERDVVKSKIKTLGGEEHYSWGIVEYSEDVKGGSVGIVIRYKGNVPSEWNR